LQEQVQWHELVIVKQLHFFVAGIQAIEKAYQRLHVCSGWWMVLHVHQLRRTSSPVSHL
jgi:hypothetical protein